MDGGQAAAGRVTARPAYAVDRDLRMSVTAGPEDGCPDMSITAQALDGVYGCSAAGVPARLGRLTDGGWDAVTQAETDAEGRIDGWRDERLERGLYRIVFDSDHYFAGLGVFAAYPEIIVMFRMREETDSYQIQVLLSPY